MGDFSHFNEQGESRMVDVTDKPVTNRVAVARGQVFMKEETLQKIYDSQIVKGNVLEVARLAGIMGAKQTHQLIPLCHPLTVSGIELSFYRQQKSVLIEAAVKVSGQTGVEMEALTAVSVAALTIYDMCKAVDRAMVISNICLVHKEGGASGLFERKDDPCPEQ
ncbi:cyclic pyranopterin monophosphate synthase MoaC|uniref:Cyclic pyranopterin monophosphate synthase n=1 Tax=Dendrosporobacter quercicolus TaxID=146817 RepID=A0A1H0AH75_9FIRM|nr:cyclic pyranopterin monophosphate synthase MoaC [Dendrosporobacter quercicolus]NSL50062.1 cyclic pyranopterin monophosphate synthase MoaC [Dendrosporobacter quercicolus DSM 1736]SDN32952.1 cyclic pyranopterin monophosphate synthase subunit MoaC [Dendrosporobacter quercicolus]